MVNVGSIAGKEVKGLTEFYLDDPSDVKDLPTNCAVGSTAICMATGDVYMMNSRKEWVDPCGGGVVVPAPVVDSLPITILE